MIYVLLHFLTEERDKILTKFFFNIQYDTNLELINIMKVVTFFLNFFTRHIFKMPFEFVLLKMPWYFNFQMMLKSQAFSI
jgi:hypothetical protein